MALGAPLDDSHDLDVVRAEGINVSFGGVRALVDVNVELRRDEILGIIGPNGAGKSTLVGVIAGTVATKSGRVFIGGARLGKPNPRLASRAGLARTFQHPSLFSTLTVGENLAMGARWRRKCGRKLSPGQADYLDALPDSLGLTDWLPVVASEIPHPVQRLVEAARAMLTAAPVVLADEPAAGLNETERIGLVNVLKDYRQVMRASILLIEHDVSLVLNTCDRVAVLHEGSVLAASSAEEIRTDQRVIDAYFGVPV
jgi:branched-chain amino acid transport system ATP-binding protein